MCTRFLVWCLRAFFYSVPFEDCWICRCMLSKPASGQSRTVDCVKMWTWKCGKTSLIWQRRAAVAGWKHVARQPSRKCGYRRGKPCSVCSHQCIKHSSRSRRLSTPETEIDKMISALNARGRVERNEYSSTWLKFLIFYWSSYRLCWLLLNNCWLIFFRISTDK
jgi:hypothetical protein